MAKYFIEVHKNYLAWGLAKFYGRSKFHREDGPAIEWANGTKNWYVNGKRHREDGPAVECANGEKEWCINDEYLTEQEFNRRNGEG